MIRLATIFMLIIFVLLMGVGLQITSENFNSLVSSEPIVFFQIAPKGSSGYELVFLGETLYLDPGDLKTMLEHRQEKECLAVP